MKKVILKINPYSKIVEDIGESYTEIPTGYTELSVESYPNDLLNQCYTFENNKFVRNESLYEQYLKNIEDEEKAFRFREDKNQAVLEEIEQLQKFLSDATISNKLMYGEIEASSNEVQEHIKKRKEAEEKLRKLEDSLL